MSASHRGQRALYPLTAFAHGLVCQPDNIEARQTRCDLTLHLDSACLQPEIGHRTDQCDHELTPICSRPLGPEV